MQLRVYLIVEAGADRIYVQTTFPAWYVKPADRASCIFEVHIPIPDGREVDGKIILPAHAATEISEDRLEEVPLSKESRSMLEEGIASAKAKCEGVNLGVRGTQGVQESSAQGLKACIGDFTRYADEELD